MLDELQKQQVLERINNIQDCIRSNAHTQFTGNLTPNRTPSRARKKKLQNAVGYRTNYKSTPSPTRRKSNTTANTSVYPYNDLLNSYYPPRDLHADLNIR